MQTLAQRKEHDIKMMAEKVAKKKAAAEAAAAGGSVAKK
jgi:hypothetical protein